MMFKKLGLILAVLFIYGCSDLVNAINNFQLPAWETEMSFQIHEDVIRIAEEINDSLILAYDCQDTTMCDTSRGQIYMIELSKDIKTDSVGNLIKFEHQTLNFEQSIDDIELDPINQEESSEIGIIRLGDMDSQEVTFFFNEIIPEDVISEDNVGSSVIIPETPIQQQEQEVSFSNFDEAVVDSTEIKVKITNDMFITLGVPINIELRRSDDSLIDNISFNNSIPPDSNAEEILFLEDTSLPGTIKVVVTGNTLGTNGQDHLLTQEDLNSSFNVNLTIEKMNVSSATAIVPEQQLNESINITLNQSSENVSLESATIGNGEISISIVNEIPLGSQLTLDIPGLIKDNESFNYSVNIEPAIGNTPTESNPEAESLEDYILSFTDSELTVNYTIITEENENNVTIDELDKIDIEINISNSDGISGLEFKSISGYFNENVQDSGSISMESETTLNSAVIDSGSIEISIENGLDLDSEIIFELPEFLDSNDVPLTSQFELLINETTLHTVDLAGYSIEMPNEISESQQLNYISTIVFDENNLQNIIMDSSLAININISELQLSSITGIIGEISLPSIKEDIPIDLPPIIGDYSNQLSDLEFYKSNIEIIFNSTINVPIELDLNLKSYVLDSDSINQLDSAFYNTVLVTDPNSNINIFELSDTEQLLNIFPTNISANISAKVGGSDDIGYINQSSSYSASINVSIPLAFIMQDTVSLELDITKTNPVEEKIKNIQHAELFSTISSNLGCDFNISAYVLADTLDTIPLDTLLNNFPINGGETVMNTSELDSTLFAFLIDDTTYIKPIITIMGEYDDDGSPLPFVIYSTDSINIDIIANANVLVDSTLRTGGN